MLFLKVIGVLFTLYNLMLLVRILSSWLPELYQYRAIQFIAFYTDPYLNFFRRFIPPIGMIDISPIFAFISLQVLESLIFFLFR